MLHLQTVKSSCLDAAISIVTWYTYVHVMRKCKWRKQPAPSAQFDKSHALLWDSCCLMQTTNPYCCLLNMSWERLFGKWAHTAHLDMIMDLYFVLQVHCISCKYGPQTVLQAIIFFYLNKQTVYCCTNNLVIS